MPRGIAFINKHWDELQEARARAREEAKELTEQQAGSPELPTADERPRGRFLASWTISPRCGAIHLGRSHRRCRPRHRLHPLRQRSRLRGGWRMPSGAGHSAPRPAAVRPLRGHRLRQQFRIKSPERTGERKCQPLASTRSRSRTCQQLRREWTLITTLNSLGCLRINGLGPSVSIIS